MAQLFLASWPAKAWFCNAANKSAIFSFEQTNACVLLSIAAVISQNLVTRGVGGQMTGALLTKETFKVGWLTVLVFSAK